MRRPWALPLVPLYGLGLWVKGALSRTPRSLTSPVMSVGSLSAGGAGKTPVVKALAALLQREGFTVDVLSRGYGRGSGAVEAVDPGGSAQRFGDEPLELAQAGLPVFLGALRFAAGVLAESTLPDGLGVSHLHLLDDGFQHRQLRRIVDVVLLTQEDAEDFLLPAGNLREPFSALRRADVIVLREDEATLLLPVAQRFPRAAIWQIRRTLVLPPETPSHAIAFCGIARPDSFFQMLREAGLTPAGQITFPDHHPYGPDDMTQLIRAAEHSGANGGSTTAKDNVKITTAWRAQLETVGPLITTELRVTVLDEAKAVRFLREAISR